jgi:hypothetical protein
MVLLAVSISVVSLLMSLGLTAPDTATVYLAVFALGGLADGLYTIGLADMTKRVPDDYLAAGNSCFVAVCGLGEILGPSMSGAGLQFAGQQGLSLVSAVAMLTLLAVAALLSCWTPSAQEEFAGFLPVNQVSASPEYPRQNAQPGVANEQDR